jgi:hypothetical protein
LEINPPETERNRGKTTKTKIKIPASNRLMERTGSLPIRENSRRRLVMFEVLFEEESGLDEEICIILLRK